MKLEEAASAMSAATDRVTRAVDSLDTTPLERVAREVAVKVRQTAQSSGDSVAIRVVRKHQGVRITVVGRRAARYRSMVERELAAKMPDASAEIRAQITRRAR